MEQEFVSSILTEDDGSPTVDEYLKIQEKKLKTSIKLENFFLFNCS